MRRSGKSVAPALLSCLTMVRHLSCLFPLPVVEISHHNCTSGSLDRCVFSPTLCLGHAIIPPMSLLLSYSILPKRSFPGPPWILLYTAKEHPVFWTSLQIWFHPIGGHTGSAAHPHLCHPLSINRAIPIFFLQTFPSETAFKRHWKDCHQVMMTLAGERL